MAVETKLFGKIEIEQEKIITFEKGLIGFPELTKFALIHNSERKDSKIRWMQSLDNGEMAFPVIDPCCILDEYDPMVNNELMERLGEYKDASDLILFVILRVPEDIKDMSINLKAPVIINTLNNKAIQLIVEGDYAVRFPVYDILQERKEKESK